MNVLAASTLESINWTELTPLSLDISLTIGIIILLLVDLFQPEESESIAGPLAAAILASWIRVARRSPERTWAVRGRSS